MIPKSFLLELWREFVHNLQGTHVKKEEFDVFFKEIYENAIKLYKSRFFQHLKNFEIEWLKNAHKDLTKAKDYILTKAKQHEILIEHKNEYVINEQNLLKEKIATRIEEVKHHFDKRMGL